LAGKNRFDCDETSNRQFRNQTFLNPTASSSSKSGTQAGAHLSRILFIGGSLNVTTMMHQISRHLSQHECRFTPFYVDGPVLSTLRRLGMLEHTVVSGKPRSLTLDYIKRNNLILDDGGHQDDYNLVVMGTDIVVPKNIAGKPIVLVQEGMTDPENYRYHLVRRFGFPRYLANTSTTGLSHAYTNFCVASEGFRQMFLNKGVPADRMVVTGIPNFDHASSYFENDFPHRNYVLAVTSCLRENLKYENRKQFIEKSLDIAGGRKLIFKLHPNEKVDRARYEIERYAPKAMIYAQGNTNHMIANSDVLITKYSSVVLLAAAMGKEIHCDLDPNWLEQVKPLQTSGTSGKRIAEVCQECLN
jgi:hypothetical protein